ncbi:hypothetical protein GCM10028807_04100 [Spirosoma daeguense]
MNPYLPYFFGPQAEYYVQAAEEIQEGKFQFNGMAFLAGILWMGYRKMYTQAFITAAIIFGENFAEEFLFPPRNQSDSSSMIVSLLVNAIVGIISNGMYIKFANRQVNKIIANNPGASEEHLIELISEKGGVTWRGPFIVLTVIFVAALALLLLAESLGISLRPAKI